MMSSFVPKSDDTFFNLSPNSGGRQYATHSDYLGNTEQGAAPIIYENHGDEKVTDRVQSLIKKIHALEDEIEDEFNARRKEFNYRIEQRRIVFERDVRRHHKALKQKLSSYVVEARPLVVLTAPVIYSMIIPFVLLDIFVTIYQAICFPVYRIAKVTRSEYITFDRKHLSYLNGLEKLNCMYCSYGNGLLAYTVEIAARTEKHWCPIKHAKRMAGRHAHYPDFLEYGDADGYQRVKRELHEATK